jgi:hypothetical protein
MVCSSTFEILPTFGVSREQYSAGWGENKEMFLILYHLPLATDNHYELCKHSSV